MYVKAELADGVETKIEITGENVFDICPKCGKEHSIFLDDLRGLEIPIVDSRYCCEECSKR